MCRRLRWDLSSEVFFLKRIYKSQIRRNCIEYKSRRRLVKQFIIMSKR
jgi:hypothetical protein